MTKYIQPKGFNLKTLSLILFCKVSVISAFAQQHPLIKYVQPFSGTAASTTPASQHIEDKTERLANTIPSVAPPFSMTQWTPQTQLTENKCLAPYYFNNKKFYGIRGSHWISGSCTQDYGSFTIMPITGKLQTQTAIYAEDYTHDEEVSGPAYYKLKLPRYQLLTEVTAMPRSGLIRITALKSDSLYLLISPNSDQGKGYIHIDAAKGEISGYNPVHRIYQGWGQAAGFSGYFFIRIKKQIKSSGVYAEKYLSTAQKLANQKNLGAFVGFQVGKGEELLVYSGTSFSSVEAAKRNLDAEIGAADFKTVLAKSEKLWEDALAQVKVTDVNEQNKRIFYTALYHSMQHPRLFNDVDGTYPRFAGDYQQEKLGKGNYYDDFSMWDIYRAQLPLVELLKPDLANDLVNSMVLKGQHGGWMPIFPCWNSYTAAMIGDHATAFIASAYNKGIRNYNVNEAYRLMRQNAFNMPDSARYLDGKGRRGINSYLKYGFIPMEDSIPNAFHKREQVSRTLEYAYDDYALATIAKGLGKTSDYNLLIKRALNYQHVFNPAVKKVQGRYANGNWYKPFYADHRESYITEGTPRQYTFYVPQDVPGLAKLMGGRKQLENELDSLFKLKEYWHGNEPGHQIPFMYNYTASPWKTQWHIKQILDEEYSDGPGGLSGNDDAGQMSAWYVFAALGFYPLDPVSTQYQLTAPRFSQVTMQLAKGKKMEIIAHKQSKNSSYIKAIKLNGKVYTQNYINHSSLVAGGKLEFYLQDQPNKNWATQPKDQVTGLK
ncbi:GH92 family glycosyl hydrolase [Pedobacter rhizosphaerae]|uniref:Alpha-1,2-mannosidase, putative n=1 Tax=Pedobacter rhizosphaerae TaxID=390241 RepID=A0A1H9TGN7_9SPHI|nr:GH92 family glycosyl hydrolase [Pedobacter rhizosphaerae]SER96009.1 alpha-1,2-mannosidase, putative [Pedobacter rhizosphaerae]